MTDLSSIEKKYVLFKLENELYGIDIDNVKTIEKVPTFTRVPNAEHYVKGVINLRGDVVPVIDLRKKFNLPEKDIDDNSRIIIVEINDILLGLMVDSSSEVLELSQNEIDNPSSIGEGTFEEYIKGIGKKKDRLIILLDLTKLIHNAENTNN